MIIKEEVKENKFFGNELQDGKVYSWKNSYYMKLNMQSSNKEYVYIVELETGKVLVVSPDACFTLVEAELKIKL